MRVIRFFITSLICLFFIDCQPGDFANIKNASADEPTCAQQIANFKACYISYLKNISCEDVDSPESNPAKRHCESKHIIDSENLSCLEEGLDILPDRYKDFFDVWAGKCH